MNQGKLCRSKKGLEGRQPTKRQRKAVQLYGKGLTFFDAFTAAGYSPKQARKGSALFRQHPGLQIALAQEIDAFPPQTRADISRLRLVNNVLLGEDKAVQSCKLLGQDREVRMWESENQVNTVIIQPSPAMEAEILASMQRELEEERDPVEQG